MTFPCMEPANTAAIAKKLHSTALEAERQLYDMEQLLRSAANRPTLIQVSNYAITGLAANENVGIGNFNQSGPPFPTLFRNFDATYLIAEFMPASLGEGLYEVGGAWTAVASGAVNDNSLRQFRIDQERPDPNTVTGYRVVNRTGLTLFETNTGVGVDAAFNGLFRALAGDRFSFNLIHGNTSSTLTVNSGAILWVHKVSDSTLTRVV